MNAAKNEHGNWQSRLRGLSFREVIYLSCASGSTLFFAHQIAHRQLFHGHEPGVVIGLLLSVGLHLLVDLLIHVFIPDMPTLRYVVGEAIGPMCFWSGLLACYLIYLKTPATAEEAKWQHDTQMIIELTRDYSH